MAYFGTTKTFRLYIKLHYSPYNVSSKEVFIFKY
jgi:hypothetical protein